MSASSSNSRPAEEQLRALSRKALQALAKKKENIKPANAASATLIERLLAKFHPNGTKATTPVPSTLSTTPAPSGPQRKSARLETSATADPATADATGDLALTEKPSSGPAPARGDSMTDSAPILSTSQLSDPEADSALPAVAETPADEAQGASAQPSDPTHAPKPTHKAAPEPVAPTVELVQECYSEVCGINDKFIDVSAGLLSMARMQTHLETGIPSIEHEVKTFAWDGYYLESKLVMVMKKEHALWDGSNAMPQGSARDRWHAFLDEVKAADAGAMDVETASVSSTSSVASTESATAHSQSSTDRKRQRDLLDTEEEDEGELPRWVATAKKGKNGFRALNTKPSKRSRFLSPTL